MGGGKERKASMQMQTDIARQQNQTSQDYLGLAKQEQASRTALQKPAIDYYTRLTSANPAERMNAMAIPLGDLAKTTRSAKESAYDSTPRGAARDFAMAQLPMQQASQSSEMLNKAYNAAFPALSSIGTEAGQIGLQQTGAGMRSGEAAAGTNNGIMQTQQQQKASQLGMIGSLAGMGANIASGGMAGAAKKASAPLQSFNPMSLFHKTGLPQ